MKVILITTIAYFLVIAFCKWNIFFLAAIGSWSVVERVSFMLGGLVSIVIANLIIQLCPMDDE